MTRSPLACRVRADVGNSIPDTKSFVMPLRVAGVQRGVPLKTWEADRRFGGRKQERTVPHRVGVAVSVERRHR
jgi:hypothetical protein